jgi:putative hydrolase of the HAD superfamily
MTVPKPPDAVTFDCWETLITNVDWEATKRSRFEAVRITAADHGITLSPAEAETILRQGWDLHVEAWRRGEIYGGIGAARSCLEGLGIPLTDSNVAVLADRLGGSAGGTEPMPGAIEAIERVRSAGIPTALICDTGFTPADKVRGYLSEHGIELDNYFFSDEVGAPKPYPKIFEAALETLGVEASRAVHIGDLKRTDIAGARNVGMASIRYAGSHDNGWEGVESEGDEADAVLKSWAELPPLIGLSG